MVNQINSQHVAKLVFTSGQIEEQQEFTTDLENNEANIVFEGSIPEAKAYLAGINQLVDSHVH